MTRKEEKQLLDGMKEMKKKLEELQKKPQPVIVVPQIQVYPIPQYIPVMPPPQDFQQYCRNTLQTYNAIS